MQIYSEISFSMAGLPKDPAKNNLSNVQSTIAKALRVKMQCSYTNLVALISSENWSRQLPEEKALSV